MEFTKEDQYITQALTEHLKNKYGDVFVVAANDTQTMVINDGFSNEAAVQLLGKVIKSIKGGNEKEMMSKYGVKDSGGDLLDSVKNFIYDAKKNLKELDIKALKNSILKH